MSQRHIWTRGFLGLMLLPSAPGALAQTAQPEQPETVIVTGRVPDPVGSAAFSVSHLDAQDLRRTDTLDAALEQVPGLSLFRRNSALSANPTTQGVSLRSFAPSGAGRTLVMLDGVPQNDPFGGWVIWSSLPAEDISDAEIVRGAGAGPYGAGALTGTIVLAENDSIGLTAADASWGDLQTGRVAAAGGATLGPLSLFGSAAYESSAGWIPVDASQRGAADDAVTLNAKSASLRVQAEPWAETRFTARVGVYDEKRDSGLVGSASEASGVTSSLSFARAMGTAEWRLQTWLRDTQFSNSSASVAAGRVSTTPSNNQYATPALGWGVNGALRDSIGALNWEIGADARFATGESREQLTFVSGAFTQGRISGGRTFVGGLYAEGATVTDGWLLTAGVRADEWRSYHGHLVQRALATGIVSQMTDYTDSEGVLPTARAGARRAFGDAFYIRTAAYAGFRAPSLNELYRPFRLGNTVTLANALLTPENLYGAEMGVGGEAGSVTLDATVFFNQLHSAITNVTIGQGPGNFTGVGFLPAGGLLIQRRNAGDINAEGAEAEARWRIASDITVRAAFNLVDARVDGGTQAPQLTGKRPAQSPRSTITAGVIVMPIPKLSLSADLRFESARFADDQNTLRLGSATTADARLVWAMTPTVSAYAAADNLFNAQVATTQSADRVVSYDAPRIVKAGLSLALP